MSEDQRPLKGIAQNSLLGFLVRLVKSTSSLANIDIAGRQRVTVDALGASVSMPVTGTIAVSNVANIVTTAGMDQRQFQTDMRIAYNTGIRSNLNFS